MSRSDTDSVRLGVTSSADESNEDKELPLEWTVDDIHSFAAQLKDEKRGSLKLSMLANSCTDGMMGSTDGMMGSTDGMMGSTDSLADSVASSLDGGVKYETLRADLLRNECPLASSIKVDDSQEDNEWDYPDLDAYATAAGRGRTQSPLPRKGARKLRRGTDHSTRAIDGDSMDSDHSRLHPVSQNSTLAILGDDKDSDYQF